MKPRNAAQRKRKKWIIGGLATLAVVAFSVWGRHWPWDEWWEQGQKLPVAWVIAAIALLPLVGFPVSWLHLLAGARFGPWMGFLVIAVTTAFHVIGATGLADRLPATTVRRLAPWRKRLQRLGRKDAVVFSSILPGLPYTLQLYVLPLVGVPLWENLLLSVPIHAARAVVALLLADLGEEMTAPKVIGLVAYYAVVSAVSFVVVRRMRQRLRESAVPGAKNAREAKSIAVANEALAPARDLGGCNHCSGSA